MLILALLFRKNLEKLMQLNLMKVKCSHRYRKCIKFQSNDTLGFINYNSFLLYLNNTMNS